MAEPDKIVLTGLIRDKAYELGFDLFGIAPPAILDKNGAVLAEWCAAGMNAGMDYMARNHEKRIDPGLLFPGTKSVIVTGMNYYSERKQGGNGVPELSIYAYGMDYHEVIMSRLNALVGHIAEISPGALSRGFVDSAPLLEKAWASRAGLGWQGKHSVLVNPQIGSFFFLGVVLTDIGLDYSQPAGDHCGSCTLCIEACPTGAINDNRTIDARRCIAYLTLDNKAPVPADVIEKSEGRIAGCDKCQEVCPWNCRAEPHSHPEFEISEELRGMTREDWLAMTKEDYERLFGKSALSRRKYEVFIQNVTNVTKFYREP